MNGQKFRSTTMRQAFLAQDVLHSMQPVKEATSKMQVLALGPWKRLKSVGRYLVGRPRCVQRFPLQPEVESLTVKVDKKTRLSTSCCMLMRGKLVLRCSSSNQKIQGLCNSDSEFKALVLGGRYWVGSESNGRELWAKVGSGPGDEFIGSRRCCHEKRSGEDRSSPHTTVMVTTTSDKSRVSNLESVIKRDNEADIGTKPLSGDVLDRILTNLNFVFEIGLSEQALKAAING